jgi:hypothetical protein
LDAIDLGELSQRLKVWLRRTLAVGPESLNRDVESDLVPILKAVGDGLLRGIDPYRYAVNRDDFNTGAK